MWKCHFLRCQPNMLPPTAWCVLHAFLCSCYILERWFCGNASRAFCSSTGRHSLSSLMLTAARDVLQMFCEHKRAEIKAANPEAGFGETGKLLAAAWKACDADTKARFQEQSQVCHSSDLSMVRVRT